MQKIFLGGTCAGTTWRKDIINALAGKVAFYNPVVSDWTPACAVVENVQKKHKCGIHLYVLTSAMKGVYSIAEAVQSSNQDGVVTVVQVMPEGFDEGALRSLKATMNLLDSNGAFTILDDDLEVSYRILNALL